MKSGPSGPDFCIKKLFLKKLGYVEATVVVIGAILFIMSVIFLRDTDYYGVRWVGVVSSLEETILFQTL
ncbi:hypothetical protein [Bacillus atrophaeus]|uniref:hypothetical protein n=1 Tax=Bacillus atrophaeus TaxID=1452 RepID=UPI002E1CA41B|nr:hypothetical protein [Bacillus atrophaeus]